MACPPSRSPLLSIALNRRAALAGAAISGSTLLVPGHAAARQSTPESGWSFTDDKGVTVSLDAMPARVAADVNAAAPLWDFGVQAQAVFGWNASESGDFGDGGGNIDPAMVEVVGDLSEPIKIEPLVAFDPDVVITLTFVLDDPDEYWSIDAALVDQVREIAPIIAMSGTGNAAVNTERFAELAAALGADLETPELVEARELYLAATANLETVAAASSNLTILFAGIDAEAMYVANPPDWPDLSMYMEMGVNAVIPDAAPGDYWESLSLEQGLKYPADIIMTSTRGGSWQLADLVDHPVFSAHPAVKAGQVYPWNQDFIQSYQGMREAMDHLSEVLSGSSDIVE